MEATGVPDERRATRFSCGLPTISRRVALALKCVHVLNIELVKQADPDVIVRRVYVTGAADDLVVGVDDLRRSNSLSMLLKPARASLSESLGYPGAGKSRKLPLIVR